MKTYICDMVKSFLKNIILFNDQRKVFWLPNPAKTCCSFLLPHRSFTKSLHRMIKFLFGPRKTKNINIIVFIYDKHEKQQTL